MKKANSGMSRRRFLGGSMAAAMGGLVGRPFEPKLQAQDAVPWPSIPLPIEELRPTGPLDEAYWWKVKGQCNIVDGQIFMNTGTIGPVPQCILDEHIRINRELAIDPSNAWGRAGCDVVREEIGEFVGASGEEIAITRSTTEGLNIFAKGLDWKEGDEVLWCMHEHPGGIGAYKAMERRHGIKIKVIDIPIPPESVDQVVGLYEKAITPRTRVILLSHMTYVTGTLLPAKEVGEMAMA
jgi:selenocysteine lyase/cysteine desulfurase